MNKTIWERGRLLKYSCILGLMIFLILLGTQTVWAGVKSDIPYLIKVNRVHNTITVYEKDESGNYSIPVKAMICSVGVKGLETRLGTFTTKEKYRWKALMGDVYGQYSTRIVGGILFHSVYYYRNGNPATLATAQFNKLGNAASHGCIRLTVGDAKWIYDNCPTGTTVVIYDDKKSPGPLGKPEMVKIPSNIRWDPTDPDSNNPLKNKMPSIKGARDLTIPWGSSIDLLKGVTAKCSLGSNITPKIVVDGVVNTQEPGKYNITYTVTDALERLCSKQITVTVKERPCNPVFEGITDRIIGENQKVSRGFALEGVTVSCSDIIINNKDIVVKIDKPDKDKYIITYQVQGNNEIAQATFMIDLEPPVLTGVTDREIQIEQELTTEFALQGVSVSDNYSNLDERNIDVTFKEDLDGNFLVTYEVIDEVGNITSQTVLFYFP